MSRRYITATDPATGEVFRRQTNRDYAVCRVERLDAATAEQIAVDGRARRALHEDEEAIQYDAEARVIAAWMAGADPTEDDVALLGQRDVGGGNYYHHLARAKTVLAQLAVDFRRDQYFRPERYVEFAARSRAAATAMREPHPPAAPWLIVSWHHRLDLAQKVGQRDPRTTVSYLPVGGAA